MSINDLSELAPPTLPDGSPDDDAQNNLVVKDRHGDVINPAATVMRERESYERVVEGLAIAADRAKHCARGEPQRFTTWMHIAHKLDLVRKTAIEYAGLSDKPAQQSGNVRGEHIAWSRARREFREGLKQAAGGCRQIAIVHRGDAMFLTIARQIDDLADKASRRPLLAPQISDGGVLLPSGQFSRAVH